MGSKLEINMARLIGCCESLAAEKQFHSWRLEKYVETLLTYLAELKRLNTNKPSPEMLSYYVKKIDFLRGIVEAEKLSKASDKSMIIEHLAPSKISPPTSSSNQLFQTQTKARYATDARRELLGDDTVRLRRSADTVGGDTDDLNTLLRHHHQIQERLADEMVHFARNLKENAKAAGSIIRDDTSRLRESVKLVDTNYSKLKVESQRLEVHVQRGCSWWIWIALAAVICTFVWMVIMMRMFRKSH